MTIEVTSVPDRRTQPLQRLACLFANVYRWLFAERGRLVLRIMTATVAVVCLSTTTVLWRSYKSYAALIDSRLANGYLTDGPGIYAAPRTLRSGQQLPRERLLDVLRRAGYIAGTASEVWSGSYELTEAGVRIHPATTSYRVQPRSVDIDLGTDGRISAITGDGVSLDAFTLAPELLSKDLSAKPGKRLKLSYDQIPLPLVHAVLSIEDRRFFDHSGIDPFGIGRALWRNAGDERVGQGGSTITQQLVKNTYLSPERTLRRKFAEAMLALALERRLSKQDIFALYCNEVYLGQRGAVAVRGVAEAAHIYFGKDPDQLSLGEAATIAGMIQQPASFAPHRHPEAAAARRDVVLETMVRDSWITGEQERAAVAEPVRVAPAPEDADSVAPYFLDLVEKSVDDQQQEFGAAQRIFTTIDPELQQIAEAALKRQLERLDQTLKVPGAKPQAALVALDPRTGAVLALVGGRDYAESQLNRVTDAHRQPGSTFKPFVYAAALESGISPVQMFSDAPREFTYDRNKIYRPANFGGGFSMRDVTMRTGSVKSLNVVTVDVAMQTGLARIANLATRFGLPKPPRYLALALGTTEVTPLELAAAYSAFANGGHRVQPTVIRDVGGVLEAPGSTADENHAAGATGAQIIEPTTAYMITNMLTAVIDHGTGRAARGAVPGTALAGKTGTSRDGWFVGYTPNLVCVVWIGFDDNHQLGLTGAEAALPAWTEFMKAAVGLRPELGGGSFSCPEGIRFVEVDADTGLLSTLSCPHRELIAVTRALAPNFECYLHGNVPATEEDDSGEEPRLPPPPQRQARNAGVPVGDRPATAVAIDSKGRKTLVNEMRVLR
jgi:penicillin-binding protein 1B